MRLFYTFTIPMVQLYEKAYTYFPYSSGSIYLLTS